VAGVKEVLGDVVSVNEKPFEVNRETFQSGELALVVIRRGERFALRVKYPNSPVRLGFQGLRYFPIDRRWRVQSNGQTSENAQDR
jgi:uncharacterized protein (DUF1684 family)